MWVVVVAVALLVQGCRVRDGETVPPRSAASGGGALAATAAPQSTTVAGSGSAAAAATPLAAGQDRGIAPTTAPAAATPASPLAAIVPAPLAAATPTPGISTVFIILMENHNWSAIKGNARAPYINNTLLPMASHAEQYFNPPGNHPSLPNYLWLEGGTNFGVHEDGDPSAFHQSTTDHLVTRLDKAGVTWKAYQEDISGTDCPLTTSHSYAARHDPMLYFDDVTEKNNAHSAYCISHIRPYGELAADLQTNKTAQYNFITPNLCHDMHNYCAPTLDQTRQGDNWLAAEVPHILNSAAYKNGGVLFITWDEGQGSDGPIGMLVLSPFAKGHGYSNTIHYTHSSTLRTIQEIFKVQPFVGDAANATDLGDLFAIPLH